MSSDIQRVREALGFIDSTSRAKWVEMGMAIHAEFGEAGFDLWDSWSQQAENYKTSSARDVWRGFRTSGGKAIGSLIREAKSNGWRDDGMHQRPTTEELAERRRIAAGRAANEDAEIARERADTASKAAAILTAATKARADHPYLVRKQVSPVTTLREIDASAAAAILGYAPRSGGNALAGRLLVVPVKRGSALSTVELIDGDGRKTALAGRGSKMGGHWASQRLPDGEDTGLIALIAEGMATGLSASQATGFPAVAALSSGNLVAVAKSMRERYPAATLVILADLLKTTGKPDPHAVEAAQCVSGRLAIPNFGPDRNPAETDFNDMHSALGSEAVRKIIQSALGSLDSDVTGVTDVRASVDAGFAVTSHAEDDVTDVTRGAIPGPDERPRFVVFDEASASGPTKYRAGVWYFGTKAGKGDAPPTLIEQWVCSPLYVAAVTFDRQEGNFGRLLRLKNTLGKWRTWAMPMEMLRGAGDELRGELLAMGVQIDPSGHRVLGQYLQSITPSRKVRCALSVGWCGADYVLPDEVIGENAAGVIFQSGERGHDEHTRAGSLEGWRHNIASLAVGNPLLMMALSASFAGPLLARCNAEGGGIHFVGDSSTGKTTAIEAACATWGGTTFRRSWRATANGMEGAASLFNDCLLALDEISECDPREVGAIIYALGNGRGKQRASRSGAARGVTQWRTFVLSSGERTIETTMGEAGHRIKAGQSVRLLDIPASRTHGAWDNLHGFPSGNAFSDSLKTAAATHYGHAGRAYLHKLARDKRDFAERLNIIKGMPEFAADDGEGQDRRAAGRFALLALAGELATEYGLTGWPEGAAIVAAAECFKAWRASRGRGNDERKQILDRVADFIERHGDSRFSCADASDTDTKIINRAGWWRDNVAGRTYLFHSAGMREAVTGFDLKRALDVLQEAGALPKAGGERSKPERIAGRNVRLYTILAVRLRGGYGA
jgi:putative DNA primase/helicase